MHDLVSEFSASLNSQGKLTDLSIQGYVADVEIFAKYLEGTALTYQNVTRDVVLCWIDAMEGEGYSLATQGRKVCSVRRFFRFLVTTGRVATDPTTGVELHRGTRRPPFYQIDPETLCALESPIEYAGSQRDAAVITFLGRGGLRVSELVALKQRNLVPIQEGIVVEVEGPRGRKITFRGAFYETIQAFQSRSVPKRADPDAPLFQNLSGQPMTRQGIWRAICRRATRLGLTKSGPARLRSVFVQTLLQTRASSVEIAHAAGFRHRDSLRMHRLGAPAQLAVG